jgi:tRNA dimethylallyltransferase
LENQKMMTERTRVVALMGATGSGKARLSVAVARSLDAILLSCDSMKVYRRMDAGTAKPSLAMREGVDWRGLDLVEPWEDYDASRFAALFDDVLSEARSSRRPLLLSGGSMLYLKAATEGFGEQPPRDPALRERLEAEGASLGSATLHARLADVDPATAARVHPNDLRRIVRGLEVHTISGQPLSSFHGSLGRVRPDIERVVCVIRRGREDMDQRIDVRVERMVEQGWVDECRALLADPRGVSPTARQALGYAELFAWLERGASAPLEPVIASIQTHTRRFARRQLTWVKHLQAGAASPGDGSGWAEDFEVGPSQQTLEFADRLAALCVHTDT